MVEQHAHGNEASLGPDRLVTSNLRQRGNARFGVLADQHT